MQGFITKAATATAVLRVWSTMYADVLARGGRPEASLCGDRT